MNKKSKSGKKSGKNKAPRNPPPPKLESEKASEEVPGEQGGAEEVAEAVDPFGYANLAREYTTADSMIRIIHDYFPPELRTIYKNNTRVTNDDELRGNKFLRGEAIELVRKFMDKYPGNFKAYGSPEEVLVQLRIYRTFPASHRYFGYRIDHPYSNTSTMHFLPDMKLIVKPDFYVFLFHFLIQRWPRLSEYCLRFVAIYMKTLEARIGSAYELADMKSFQPQLFLDQADYCENTLKSRRDVLVEYQLNPESAGLDEVCQEWRSRLYGLHPGSRVTEADVKKKRAEFHENWIEWTEEEFRPIRNLLAEYIEAFPPKENQRKYAEHFFICIKMAEVLFNHCYFSAFVPYDLKDKSKNEDPLLIRRFYVNCDMPIVMKSEIHHFYPECMENIPYETEEDSPFLQTVTFRSALLQYGIDEDAFFDDVLESEASSMKPRPLLTPFGGFCLYGAFALKSALRRVTSSFRLFQRLNKGDQVDRISRQLVDLFIKYLGVDQRATFFVKMEQVKKLDRSLQLLFDQISLNPMQNTVIPVEPRGVPANGMYTVKELKKQMDDMKLGIPFSNIKQKAEKAMKQVKRGKWTTKALIDILDRCQASCFIDKFPMIQEFMHRQFVPHEPCSLCSIKDTGYFFDW